MAIAGAPAAKQTSSPPQHPSAEGKLDIPVPLIGASITVAGGLLAAFLIHRWSSWREARSRKAAATLKFREAFTPEIIAAENDISNRINYVEFLRAAHNERHAQAVKSFEPFVPADSIGRFRRDWNRYRYGERADGATYHPDIKDMDHNSLYFLEYSAEFDLQRLGWPREKALKRIHQLMSYAGET